MKLGTGARGTCRTCDGEIYFSKARDADDPWVHSDWTKHVVRSEPDWANKGMLPPYDHPAEPVMVTHLMTIAVTAPARRDAVRSAVQNAARDSDLDARVLS